MIIKSAGILINKSKILLVRKSGTSMFISPGGKVEARESFETSLARELMEELCIKVNSTEFFCEGRKLSALENEEVLIRAFLVNYSGTPKPEAEIEELLWWNSKCVVDRDCIGSVFSDIVIPRLMAEGMVS